MTFVWQSYAFHHEMTCSHYHKLRKFPGKLQETSLSQPFFHAKSDATRVRLGLSIPEGILPTNHDHALPTKNSRALAL